MSAHQTVIYVTNVQFTIYMRYTSTKLFYFFISPICYLHSNLASGVLPLGQRHYTCRTKLALSALCSLFWPLLLSHSYTYVPYILDELKTYTSAAANVQMSQHDV